ncbi:type IV secretory system conjugative DNA transfer family protein [Chloroflexus sp.]|uniref:type IV secretory system conjugative DNA transfer family protein n=1 Tax=Chloroflexus sp. TaxID=1904827 RepID=UPI002604F09D|nr:type IV secretory system conjugative DNA transfer family protein [uncultured Chloroflexus sp.]
MSLAIAALLSWIVALSVFAVARWATLRDLWPDPVWLTFWTMLLVITSVTPVVAGSVILVVWALEQRAYLVRARLVRDRMMNPVPADMLARLTPNQYLALLDKMVALERDVAPHRVYRGVESLSVSQTVNAAANGQAARTEPPRALPVDPPEYWLPELLADEAHIIVAGRTSCGKTTTAAALLSYCIDAGDAVCVIDPHAGTWHGVPAIGQGRDYNAIRATLLGLEGEMTQRYQRMANGMHADITPLVVVIDEVPTIALELGDTWKRLATCLGSEARKAGIRMILLTQSPLVEDVRSIACGYARADSFWSPAFT